MMGEGAIEDGLPKNEYPRPQFRREGWINLNGEWEFDFDDENVGMKEKWYRSHEFTRRIQVPFAYQTRLSGIHDTQMHDVVWYRKKIDGRCLEPGRRMQDGRCMEPGRRILLHFGACDYETEVWVNGEAVGTHVGGSASFTFEITDYLTGGENLLVVRAKDESRNLEQPRGKQFWKQESASIFYTRTTGIWQTVWLEPVGEQFIRRLWMTPDVDRKMIGMEILLDRNEAVRLKVEISYQGTVMVCDTVGVLNGKAVREWKLDQNLNLEWEHKSYEWTPEHPVLFDVRFELEYEGRVTDQVKSYFAMRKVSVEHGKFLLNNRPYYQKLLLDQGYWRDSLLTAPDDEALIRDIRLCKEMGFNGVRKHQKVEEERFLYWADRMGFLVWEEFASAYIYSREYTERMVPEWMEVVKRDYNHPCIVAWVPLNESWGVDNIMHSGEEQAHSACMYYLTKSLDTTRMVISNDGWNHTKSDLLTVHDYTCDKAILMDRYQDLNHLLSSMPANRTLYAKGWSYGGEPVIVSEFGGIAYRKNQDEGWGYAVADSGEHFLEQYGELVSAMLDAPLVQGYVYTQLCDVEQEINGLLTYDREPKVPVEQICKINQGKGGCNMPSQKKREG